MVLSAILSYKNWIFTGENVCKKGFFFCFICFRSEQIMYIPNNSFGYFMRFPFWFPCWSQNLSPIFDKIFNKSLVRVPFIWEFNCVEYKYYSSCDCVKEHGLHKVAGWCSINHFLINPDKTQFILLMPCPIKCWCTVNKINWLG